MDRSALLRELEDARSASGAASSSSAAAIREAAFADPDLAAGGGASSSYSHRPARARRAADSSLSSDDSDRVERLIASWPEKDSRKYPDMRSDEMEVFYQQLGPEMMRQSAETAGEVLQDGAAAAASSSAAGSEYDGGATDGEYEDLQAARAADLERLRELALLELVDIDHELRLEKRIAEGSVVRPDVPDDVIGLPAFSIIQEQWVVPILSEPSVNSAFIYLQTVFAGGLGAVAADVDSTVFFLEALGMTVTKGDASPSAFTYRARFAPLTLLKGDKKTASSRASSSSAAADTAHVISRDNVLETRSAGRTGVARSSLAERISARETIEFEDDPIRMHKEMRRLALEDEKPISGVLLGIAKAPPTRIQLLEAKKRQLVGMVDAMSYYESDEEYDDSGEYSDSESSDSEFEETDDEDAHFGGARKFAKPSGVSTAAYDILSDGVRTKMTAAMRTIATRTQTENPDSVAKSMNELSAWVEECLCIDIAIYPGTDDPSVVVDIPRQLVYAFGICTQAQQTVEALTAASVP